MMKIFVTHITGKSQIVISDILPRIGDSLDIFCIPRPKVKSVLLWPSADTLRDLDSDIEAIVAVD